MTHTLQEAMERFRLVSGAGDGKETACVMSAANWLKYNNGSWTDSPPCACPVIRDFLIPLNDSLPNDLRERIWPYAEKVLDTRSTPAVEKRRAKRLAHFALTVAAPDALDSAHAALVKAGIPSNLDKHAAGLREKPSAASAAGAASAASAARAAWDAGDASAAWAAGAANAARAASAASAANAAWAARAAGAASAAGAAWERMLPHIFAALDDCIAMGAAASRAAEGPR